MNTKKLYNYIMIGIIAVTVVFIFLNSFTDSMTSRKQTEAVTDVVAPIIQPVVHDTNRIFVVIRKLAHVFEFGVLGIELSFLFKKLSIYPVFMVMVVGLTDETIQLSNNRFSRVQDVWLDCLGGIIGIVVGLFMYRLIVKLINRHKKSKQIKTQNIC